MNISSPVAWLGGKARLASKIIGYFPPHKTYVEPFGGSAAVLLAKQPSPIEVFNDIDRGLINLFQVLRDSRSFKKLCSPTIPLKRPGALWCDNASLSVAKALGGVTA